MTTGDQTLPVITSLASRPWYVSSIFYATSLTRAKDMCINSFPSAIASQTFLLDRLYKTCSIIKNELEGRFRMLAFANDVSETMRLPGLFGRWANPIANSGYFIFGAYVTTCIGVNHYIEWRQGRNRETLMRNLIDSIVFQATASFLAPLAIVLASRAIYNRVAHSFIDAVNGSPPSQTNKLVGFLFRHRQTCKPIVTGFIPMGIALGLLSQCIHPIDESIKTLQRRFRFAQHDI